MGPFTATLLTSLGTELAKQVANGLGRAARDRILGTPAEQALERALEDEGVGEVHDYPVALTSPMIP